jgi:serine/threonine protein kinase
VPLKRAHPGREREMSTAVETVRTSSNCSTWSSRGRESWLVIEYVSPRDLGAIIADDGVLPAERAIHIGRQLADALDVLHASGNLLTFISPGNDRPDACVRN